jgi:tripartite-type tricarboxylate transporter receptor subunit TctC
MTMTSSQSGFVRMLAAVAVLLACAGGAGRALAEWQPTKPVQFIVMAGKGGGADKATRAIVEMIAKQNLATVPFEVVNMPGQSGGDALAEMIKRSGDNHLLLFTLNSFYTTPLEQPALKADIAKFGPVARMGEDVFLLWVNARQSDIRNIEDFAAAAKAKGKGWVMVGTGRGSEDQMLTDFLNATYGLEMTYVSKGGGGEVARELAEQRADSTVNNPSEQDEFYPKGVSKPIVAFTPTRLKAYVAVPTLRETGMDFTYFMQRSVVGPPGMSAEALAWYQALFKALFDSPDWQAYRQKNSLSGAFLSGPALMDYWLAEREKHSRWKMAIELMGGK